MANSILIKRSAVAAKIPATTDLQLGELALNTYDGKLFLKKNNGADAIVEVGAVKTVSGRTGDVVLTNADVGLGNAENKSSATIRSELTSGNVTTALGFTPYNATNPANYITSAGAPVQSVFGRTGAVVLSSGDVTTALGYTPVNTTAVGAVNGVASLDSTGKILPAQLPSITITDTFVVASQAAMLALTVQTGDVAVRTDLNKSFIVKGADGSVIGNWQELLTPVDVVQSVAGRTGTVTLTSTDVGLNLVENKSSATIRSEITSGNVTTALGFTPYNATNPANYITSAGAPVQSVAGRTGAVVLAQADISGLTVSSTPTFAAVTATGLITANSGTTGLVTIGGDANGGIEVGASNRATAGTPFIDFHSAANSGDYDVRMIASGGTSASSGQGTLNVSAALFTFSGASIVVVNPVVAAKTGDIKVAAGIISIFDGSAWKQVFPAVYA